MSGGKWNVEKYRSPYESEDHWKLKRDFMLAHMDRIEEDRLVCLAQVYFNIELLGCRYPAQTMKEVEELAKEIGMSYKEKKKNMLKRTFVPASDAAEAKVRGTGAKQPTPTPPKNGPQITFSMTGAKPSEPSKKNVPLSRKPVAFVKGTAAAPKEPDPPANSTTLHVEPPRSTLPKDPPAKSIPPEFSPAKSVPPELPPAKSIPPEMPLTESIPPQFTQAKCFPPIFPRSMPSLLTPRPIPSQVPPAYQFIPNPAIDEYLKAWDNPNQNSGFMLGPIDPTPPPGQMKVVGTQTEHSGAITANITPFKTVNSTHDAVINFGQPQPATSFHRTMWGPSNETGERVSLNTVDLQKCAEEFRNSEDPLTEFVITTRDYVNVTPAMIMLESSRFCKIPIRYDFQLDGECIKCTLFIGNFLNVTVKDAVKKAAKDAASREALNLLRQKCWTIKVLKIHAAQNLVSVEDVWKSTIPDSTKLGDNNKGNKMLKMMGWTGGGLGKDGTGISEPIKLKHVLGRECLGADKTPASFTKQMDQLVNTFSKNPNVTDLAFSSEFSKEQRAEIHRISRKYRLTSHSHGSGPNRFLVLSRKYTAKELVYKLLQEGGRHEKYVLIPPGGTDPI